MEYRTLGRTGLKVSLLGYGTGGAGQFGATAGLDAQARISLVRRCLELGVNFFDTAGGYGNSEEFLGKSLRGVQRDSYVLCTKWNGGRSLADGGINLRESVERSLQRLRTDHLDVFLFHGIQAHLYQDHVERYYPDAAKLKEEGKIQHIGFSQTLRQEPKFETLVLALENNPELWDVVMLKYGIMNQWAARDALPLVKKHDVGIINMAVVRTTLTNSDVLAERLDEWRADATIPADALNGDDPLGWLVHDDVGSIAEAAYRFAADQAEISTVLTGTANIEHLESNAAALARGPLAEADRAELLSLLASSWSPN